MDPAFFRYLAILPIFFRDVKENKAALTDTLILAILPNNKK
jgi:hypothetical protein